MVSFNGSGMPSESRLLARTPVYLGALFLLWLAVYGVALFQPPLMDDADSVHAEAAREILVRHDWVTLHANGIRYLEKAPLLYWTIAASFRIFGIHDWSARLPLALGVLALLSAVYFLGRRVFGEKAGFYAALASGLSFGPFIFTRFLIPDILVGLWLILSLDFFLRTLDEAKPSRYSCWGLAVVCGLNVLTKGLIGLVFPLAAIGLYLFLTRNLLHLLKMRLISSTCAFLLVAAPWHILAGLRNPGQGSVRGFFWFYFVNEQFLRYLNKRVPRDYGTVPLVVFWGLVLVWLLPWSSFLPQALASVRLSRIRETADSGQARARLVFFLCAFFTVFFFSSSTRQEYYVLPALAPLALLIGGWLAEEEASHAGSRLRRWGRLSSSILAVLGLAAALAAVFFALMSQPVPPSDDIASLLHSGLEQSQQYALSLGHFLDLNARVMALFRTPLLLFGLSWLAGSGMNWHFRRRNRPELGNWSLALMSVYLLFAVHIALITFSPVLTSKPLADVIARVYQPGDIIEINGEYEGGSTLNYYTGHQVRILNGRSANLWYGSLFPDAPQIFDDASSFQRLWNGPRRVFLWSETEKQAEALQGIDPKTVFPLSEFGGKVLLTNRPVP
jgi:4-amino-4-deoxy-L-arabinose transferase-like glycosyltransferase